jgi:hypothetical protein
LAIRQLPGPEALQERPADVLLGPVLPPFTSRTPSQPPTRGLEARETYLPARGEVAAKPPGGESQPPSAAPLKGSPTQFEDHVEAVVWTRRDEQLKLRRAGDSVDLCPRQAWKCRRSGEHIEELWAITLNTVPAPLRPLGGLRRSARELGSAASAGWHPELHGGADARLAFDLGPTAGQQGTLVQGKQSEVAWKVVAL